MSSGMWLEESPGGLSKCCSIRWPAAGPVAGLHRGWKRSPLCGRSFDSPRAEWIHILSGSQGDRRGGCTSMPPLGLFPPEVGQLAVGMCLHARPASSVHKLARGNHGEDRGALRKGFGSAAAETAWARGLAGRQHSAGADSPPDRKLGHGPVGAPAGRQSSFKCPFGNLALSRFISLYVTQDK